jgi:uncharacterized protein YbbC (DUF1343 family)
MSFVAAIPVPFCYGLTPGQTALWLREKLKLDLDLRVVAARGVPPSARWIPPSPAIRSPAHALAYPATVLFEAFPALDIGRQTDRAFLEVRQQPGGNVGVLEWWSNGSRASELHHSTTPSLQASFQGLENGTRLSSKDWKRIAEEVSRQLSVVSGPPSTDHEPLTTDLCGVHIAPLEKGLRLRVTNLADYRPALVGVALVRAVQQVWGEDQLWEQNGARQDWFDKLLGTDRVRLALRAGAELAELGAMWDKDCAAFRREVAR